MKRSRPSSRVATTSIVHLSQIRSSTARIARPPSPRIMHGVLEVLGALGLLLPPLTGIAVPLAVAAAAGLVLVQIGGMTLH
ncbi:DoxX family protein, partial [Streptomyces sp. NPDC057757]|uniref:DoxX family protein n=1 Tax=Streptomyces sp. NPDC057757 TaxID=3346241 RepID=UPI00367990C0